MVTLISRLITLGLCLLLCQCYWNEPPPLNTIVFGLSSEPKTLDPRYATDAGGQRINHLIFSSLVSIGEDLKIKGNLAESWIYDNQTYTFKLKPGIKFHSGEFATAEDFIFSFDEFRKKRSLFSKQFEVIEKVEASYDPKAGGELKLFLKSFSAPFINDLPSLKLLPKKIVTQKGEDFYAHPIGSGPYEFAKMDLKNIHLSRFKDYFGDQPRTEKIQFKVIKDGNTRFQKMYKGQIDIVQSDVPLSKVKFFENEKDFEVVVQPGLSTTYVLLNLRHPLLAKKEVRRAINSAIKRQELITYTHEGYAEPATSIVTRINPFFNKSLNHEFLADRKVKEIFKSYEGKPIILKTSNTQGPIENGRIITHQLKSMGLPVEQQTYEWGTYYEDIRTGKFDMAIMKWVGVNDPDIYRLSLHSEMTPPGRNRGYYSNKDFDRIVDQAFREPDLNKRQELYLKAQEIVFSDLPTIPLWYEKQVAIVNKRVKNYALPRNGDFSALLKVFKEDERRQ